MADNSIQMDTIHEVKEKKRIDYLDFMKGLCIMLIVMVHVDNHFFDSLLPGLNYALESFRIPLYFFLSGLFFKTYSGFNEFLRKKVNNLIITLLFFHFLCSALQFPLVALDRYFGIGIVPSFEIVDIIPPFWARSWKSAGALWFLVALFGVNMLFYLFQHFCNKTALVIAVIATSIIGYVLMANKIMLPLEFDVAMVAMPFFILGYIINHLGLLRTMRYDWLGWFVIVANSFVVYFLSSEINLLKQIVPNYFLLYAVPFIAILSLFWCSKNLRYIPIICYYGRYSIVILGSHQILIAFTKIALLEFTDIRGRVFTMVTFVLTMLIELLVIKLMITYLPRFCAQKEFFSTGWKVKSFTRK